MEWEYKNAHMDVSNASEFRLTQAPKQVRKIIGAMENSSYKEIQSVGFLTVKRR